MIRGTGRIEKSEANKNWYDQRGYHMTGETLTEEYENGMAITYVVFRGSWTRHGTVRDCGDHFIIARHSRFDSIDKKTLEVTIDVEDK